LKLVLELDRPNGAFDDAGFPSVTRFRSTVSVRIPFLQPSEAESEDAMWQRVEWEFRRSLAFELLGTDSNMLGALTKTLIEGVRADKGERLPSFLGTHVPDTQQSPSSGAPAASVPALAPTLPSQTAPVLEPSDEPVEGVHVDASPDSGVV
jgi:hypothetical protein